MNLKGDLYKMDCLKIKDFNQGMRIEGIYLIKSLDFKTTNSNNKKYIDLYLCDKTGEINAKFWDAKDEDRDRLKENFLAKVSGVVLAWQGTLQLKVDSISNLEDMEGIDIEEYVQCAPYKSEDMLESIYRYINSMKNKDLKDITSYFIEENKERLMYYPAAKKNHHALRGGLLYHTLTMLKSGEALSNIYTFLNKELLYAGIILHDMCKMDEMDSNTLGFVKEYSVQGQLLGHISLGVGKIEYVGESLGISKEITMLLKHMVLSHHYEPEYGSPVKPMMPEAEMLHYLDIVDARMYDMEKALKSTSEGEFSERIWSLENRKVYRPSFE